MERNGRFGHLFAYTLYEYYVDILGEVNLLSTSV